MADFTLAEVCTATNAKILSAGRTHQFTGVSTDTRTVEQGNLFVALVGERFDGHDFVMQAVAKGAAGVVVSKEVKSDGAATLLVDNTLSAFQALARFHRLRYRIPIIAVTGSNGKTTTKDMIAAVLASRLEVLKTQANYNNEVGLPLTLLNLTKEHNAAVVEMGMRGKGEIKELAEIALPTMAVVTNVGETHIELLGSVENIAAAKSELVEAMDEDGVVVLNADDRHVAAMRHKTKAKAVQYGLSQDADIRAENIVTTGRETTYTCITPHGSFEVAIPVPGKHNVYNSLAAVAVGLELGLEPQDIVKGLQNFQPSAMRLHIKTAGEYIIINDAYNASPLSMSSAIDTLADVAQGRKIAVLGDMLELGHIAVAAHRQIGVKLAEKQIDVVITVGQLGREIAAAACEHHVGQVVACATHEEAQTALKRLLQPGDTILIKGSRGMKMEKIVEIFD